MAVPRCTCASSFANCRREATRPAGQRAVQVVTKDEIRRMRRRGGCSISASNGRPIDLVIASKFPSYFVRHPNKIAWLIHRCRAAYELCGTVYSDFGHTESDIELRDTLMRLDTQMLGECRRVFTNARNTASRLEKFNGLRAEPLYHPPRLAPRLTSGLCGDYLLSVGRIESVKRVDLIVRAMTGIEPGLRLIVAGDGTQRANMERLAHECGVADRVQFLGTVDEDLIG